MRVRVLPYQPHCFAFGGFELQMLDALRATKSVGVDIQPLDVWSRDAAFDILHVWGLGELHFPTVYWAKKSGKRVVMTALLPYLTPRVRLRNFALRLSGRRRTLFELASLLDLLVVVNEEQAETAEAIYGIHPDKIEVIPNIIGDQYYRVDSPDSTFDIGMRDYLLCVGAICPRKNQLRLAQAAIATGVPLLLVGSTLAGAETYGEDLAKLIAGRESIRWITGLPAGSSELNAAYRGCIGFVLVSFDETQPISALEAAAGGKPLMLADRPWANQNVYRAAHLVEPDSLLAIQAGIVKICRDGSSHIPQAKYLEQCRSHKVGQAYSEAFSKVMRCGAQ